MHFTLCMFLSWLQIGKQKLTKERLFRSIQYKQISFFFLFFLAELHGLQNLIPSQGSNLCRLQWKHGVLTTEPSRKYPKQIYLSLGFMKHWKYQQIFLGFLQSWHLFALFSDKPLRQRDLQKIMGEVSVASSEIFYFPNCLLVSIWATQRTWDLESILPTLIFINLALILPTSKDSYNRDNLCEQSGT